MGASIRRVALGPEGASPTGWIEWEATTLDSAVHPGGFCAAPLSKLFRMGGNAGSGPTLIGSEAGTGNIVVRTLAPANCCVAA